MFVLNNNMYPGNPQTAWGSIRQERSPPWEQWPIRLGDDCAEELLLFREDAALLYSSWGHGLLPATKGRFLSRDTHLKELYICDIPLFRLQDEIILLRTEMATSWHIEQKVASCLLERADCTVLLIRVTLLFLPPAPCVGNNQKRLTKPAWC